MNRSKLRYILPAALIGFLLASLWFSLSAHAEQPAGTIYLAPGQSVQIFCEDTPGGSCMAEIIDDWSIEVINIEGPPAPTAAPTPTDNPVAAETVTPTPPAFTRKHRGFDD